MAKRLNYEIGFTADTSELNSAIQKIQSDLSKISLGKVSGTSIASEINEAADAAGRLNLALKNAINVDTGRLDLSKFAEQIHSSGLTLDQYRQKLNLIGASGTEAFMNVAKVITQAELPMARSNKLLDSLWVTMKNTARWQLTSSALHGFMGGLQTCYGYAQDLNSSLNNIRIVTGQSSEQMAEFAKQANSAAKALSSTTTDYTDAALIYYQQGLDDKAVKDRTDTTIKMANVTATSAQEVSDQLTAIWNNFYDGSESLEYYADVITALGAATASSSAEISEGLEKFAAIASSVGLSYEYATSALATVTATTRQSADVVGTAFKTLFARIQGLQLGETLEDGTDLNKYSQALMQVGINIKDENDQLKDMDVILDEMAEKWQTLSKDQQLALAQTVAGVRQYTQLVALMDNWDFMEENLATANSSTGTLQEQADIYAESWEAARDRVQAAAEDVYSSLINEDFFIGIDNSITGVLDRVDDVIDAMGGFGGVLITVGTLMTSVYGDKMAQGIRNIAYNVSYLMGIEQARAVELKKEFAAQLQQTANDLASPELISMADAYTRQAEAQIQLNDASKQLTTFQREQLQQEVQLLNITTQRTVEYSESAREARERLEILKETIAYETQYSQQNFSRNTERYDKKHGDGAASNLIQTARQAAGITGEIDDKNIDKLINKYAELRERISQVATVNRELERANEELQNAQSNGSDNIQQLQTRVQTLRDRLAELGSSEDSASQDTAEMNAQIKAIAIVLTSFIELTEEGKEALTGLGQAAQSAGINGERLTASEEAQRQAAEALKAKLQELTNSTGDWANRIVSLGTTVGQFAMAWNAIQSLGKVFSDEDMSAAERFTIILTSLSMLIPLVGTAYKFLTNAEREHSIVQTIVAAATAGETVSLGTSITAKAAATVANKILAVSEGEVATSAQIAGAAIASQLIMIAPYIAAIAGVAVGIYALVQAYHADADAAKKAAEAAEETANAAEEAKSATDQLRSSIDGYDSAVEKLNECTEGTQEWRDALKEVNEAVIEVLNNAGKLNAEDLANLRNDDGTLNRDALTDLQEQADERANNLAFASAAADKYAADMQLRADAMALGRKAHGASDNYDRDVLLANYEELAKLSKQELAPALRDLGFSISDSESTIDTWYDSIQEMADSAEAAGEKFNLISQMKVEEILGTPDADDVLGKAVNAVATSNLDTLTQQLTDEWEEKLTGSGISKVSGADNTIYQETLKALQDAGYDVSKQTDNTVRGSDSDRSLAFLNSQGEEVVYNSEQIAAMIAAAQALNKVGTSADEVAGILTNLKNTVNTAGEDIATGIQNYIATGNFESMTGEEFKAMQDAITNAGGADAYLQKALGMTGEKIAQVLGTDYLDNFETAAKDYDNALSNFTSNLRKSVQDAYSELDSDKETLNVTGQKAIAQAMEDAVVQGGQEGLKAATSIIDAVDENNIQGFADVLDSMDWDTQGPEDFVAALDEAGVETNSTTEALLDFGKIMSKVGATDFSTLAENYAEIHKIIDDLETGDTISAEDYEALGDAGEGYFTKMLDGTYKLTGDAEKFYETVQQQQIQEFQDFKTEISDQKAALQGISGYDMDSLSQTSVYTNDEGKEVYSTSTLEKQLEILEAMNYNAEELDEWKKDFLDDGDSAMDTQSLQDIADAVADVNAQLGEDGLSQQIDALETSLYETDLAILSSCSSLKELKDMYAEGEYSAQAYNQALINLDKQLDTQDLDTDEWEEYADYLQDIAKDTDNLSDGLADNDDAAKIVAKSIMKMNDGIDDLADGYDDWVDVLNKSSKESEEFSNAINDMRDALANVLDVNGEFISDDFIADHLGLIKQAATGSAEAIDQLKAALLEDIVARIIVDNELGDYDLLGQITELQSMIDSMGPLEVGATVDDADFINACNEIIRNAGLTADQANALFDAMGFETTFETKPQPIERTGHETITTTTVDEWGEAEMADGSIQRYPAVMRTQTSQGAAYTYTEYVDAPAMDCTAEGSGGGSPIITSLTKKATGSYNNYSSRNSGGGSPGKTSGGSGGGGGSGTEDKPKKKDETPLEDILDRYHEINDQLDDITRATKELNTETDRLYGLKKFANMDKEIRKLKEQNSLIEEKTRQAKEYLGTVDSGDMGALVNAAADVGFTLGANSFDAEGNLLNVEEIQRSMWNKLHEMEVTYNNLATGTEQETYEEEVIQPWQDKIDEFERALDLYEETRELIQDLEEERMEILREIEDIRFNKIVEQIEIRLDYKDAKKDINDLAKTIREAVGTAYDWGKDVADIDFQNMGIEKSKMNEYQDEYKKLMDLYEESKTNSAISTADIAEQLEELRGQIIESSEALVEWAESLEDVLPDAIDAAREHFDQFIDQLEHNTTVIDTIKEIMVLQGLTLKTAQGFKDIQDIHQKRMDATLSQAKLNRAWYERAAEELEQAQAALDAAPIDTEQYDILKANRDALLQEYNDAQEAMLESAKETMEEARDMYVDAVERTAYELEQTLTNSQGFDLLQDKYDHYLDTEERYLDTVNRIYETTTLNNKLQKELDKTTNAASAAKLKALQEEFQLREANNKLSQYDIDVMNAKLELTLKQMALEEAQNAKTDLRLVRNAQGNWNYQYTANQDDINAANQEYLDAMNEYYNLAKDRVEEVTGDIIDTWQEMTEKIKEIYEDESLTVEEREAAIAEIREYYTQKVKDLEEEKQKAIVDMTEAGQIAIDDFKDRHHDVLDEMGEDVDNLESIFSDDLAAILSGADDFNNQFATDMDELSKEVTDFDQVFDDTISNMEEAAQDYQDVITNVNSEVGISYDDLKDMLGEVSESTEEVTEQGLEEIDMMWDKLTALREVTEQYASMADAILEAAEAMRELAAATMEAQFSSIGNVDANVDYSALIANGLSSGELAYGSDEYNQLMSYRSFAYDERNGTENGWMNNETLDKIYQAYASGTLSGTDLDWFTNASTNYQGPYDNNNKTFEEWLEDLDITQLSTGGYTGDFENGKLAVLHEKELVLNQEDTQNLLAAVKTVEGLAPSSIWDNIVNTLDKSIAIAQGMMMDRLSSIFSPAIGSGDDNSIKEATIYAEFPNVHDAREVEEALRNLANDASQYASQPQNGAG